MTEIMNWVKQMIYLVIFLTIAIQILPGQRYQKYIRFFGGLIFVVSLIQPIVSFWGTEGWEETLFSQIYDSGNLWIRESDMDEEEMDIAEMEEIRSSLYLEYEKRLSEDLAE